MRFKTVVDAIIFFHKKIINLMNEIHHCDEIYHCDELCHCEKFIVVIKMHQFDENLSLERKFINMMEIYNSNENLSIR